MGGGAIARGKVITARTHVLTPNHKPTTPPVSTDTQSNPAMRISLPTTPPAQPAGNSSVFKARPQITVRRGVTKIDILGQNEGPAREDGQDSCEMIV
jgi:hypothetical protein